MTSPIERIPNNDKTNLPLRGEGNQKPKPQRAVNIEIKGGGLMSTSQVREMIRRVKQNYIDMEEETKMQIDRLRYD